LINGPVGALAVVAGALVLREPAARPGERRRDAADGGFDAVGFLLVATFLGALELICDRGLEDDWFGSPFIVRVAIVCGLAFLAMIPWELSRRHPMVDLRMIGTRQFGACFVVMLATGAILLATTQFLPELVQEDLGYTATWAGLILSPGGLVTMATMFVTGRLLGRVQPKHLIVAGMLIVALSMHGLTAVYGDIDFWYLARSRMLLGIGLPLIFLSITAASYDGIPPGKTDQASALINVARNTGGALGVSLASNVLMHRAQFHQSRLVEHAIPSAPAYQETLRQVTGYLLHHGSAPAEVPQQAIAWVGRQVQAQASFLAYMDVFWVLMLLSLAAGALALGLRKVKLGDPAAPAR
jgi:DHA2 family multidrug resistance protein